MTPRYLYPIAVISALSALGIAFTRLQRQGPSSPPQVQAGPAGENVVNADIGDRLCVPGVNFAAAKRNIVIAFSDSCPYCKKSEEFLRLLVDTAAERAVPVFCLAKDAPQLARLLPSYVRSVQVGPDSVGFYHVPAVAMVDHDGIISALWTGYVKDTHVSLALESLFEGSSNRTSGFESTSESELHERRSKGEPFQIVDPRTHEVAVQGGPFYLGGVQALNIPAGEISMRARYELNRDTPVIVDCRSIKGLSCQDVIATLAAQGFRDVAGLGLRSMGSSPICAASAQSPHL